MAERINSYRELRVFQAAMMSALDIFDLTRRFPAEERCALTDQIRRSSRSVCANIAEAWRKRRYRAAFIAKLNDAESEAAEAQVWLEFALRHGYLAHENHAQLDQAYDGIIGQLVRMIDEVDKWLIRPRTNDPTA